ncbi:MAG: hypothetical protein HQL13_05755, partial [Candidatus Omnitrophica bacterium]|nr:hypothetical protein [Candidatus Omnitrophota bacterium]
MAKITVGANLEFSENQKMREAIRQDINNQIWDLWASITFFGVVSKPEAEKQIRKFFHDINRTVGMQIVSGGVSLFICYEKHTDKAGVHVHTFIRGINAVHAGLIQQMANQELGDSQVEPFVQDEGAD